MIPRYLICSSLLTASALAFASSSIYELVPQSIISRTCRGGHVDPNISSDTILDSLLSRARQSLDVNRPDEAFSTLIEAYSIDPTSTTIAGLFQECLTLKVNLQVQRHREAADDGTDLSEAEVNSLLQDRMGLASLCIDKEQYTEAGVQLRKALDETKLWLSKRSLVDGRSESDYDWAAQLDRAQYLLYRTNAGCCEWTSYFEDGDAVRRSLRDVSTQSRLLLHPFDALKFPCIGLESASRVAQSYALRALKAVGVDGEQMTACQIGQTRRRLVQVDRHSQGASPRERRIKVGYISPDFTSRHPLAFLMQHVFRYHDKSKFEVYIFSLASTTDDCEEIREIKEASDKFSYLSKQTPEQMYQHLLRDQLDVLVDLCGFAGQSVSSEMMASRCRLKQERSGDDIKFPIHVSYMGFPGSTGSSHVWDYSVFDQVVLPAKFRDQYEEALVFMPHSYFVNSHRTAVAQNVSDDDRRRIRSTYGISPTAFVYCCHSRPDKIDPVTFRSWIRALIRVRDEGKSAPVLWLLRSGREMEDNLRAFVTREFGQNTDSLLVFADIADREEHLRRLACADLFLDTPAYGAHTVGCDALYAKVPMVSLLRGANDSTDHSFADEDYERMHSASNAEIRSITTDKLPSRVGASLLQAVGLPMFIADDMRQYEDLMVRCAHDIDWFEKLRERLRYNIGTSPLFDTERWVQNLEAALLKMEDGGAGFPDIMVLDNDPFQ